MPVSNLEDASVKALELKVVNEAVVLLASFAACLRPSFKPGTLLNAATWPVIVARQLDHSVHHIFKTTGCSLKRKHIECAPKLSLSNANAQEIKNYQVPNTAQYPWPAYCGF
jgi:hypothetical protein